jgi:predicted amidohydrolase
MRRNGALLATLAALALFPAAVFAGPFDGQTFKGRIAFSSDGNANDEDDWGAFPVAAALLDAFGVADRLVHVDFNNLMTLNEPRFYKEMTESVLGSVERFGLPPSVLFDCQLDIEGAVESIKNAINASSTEDPLYYVLAGPMEVPLLGILASEPDKRKHVYCISHSVWNDGFPQAEKEHLHRHTKRDVIETGVNWVQVKSGSGLTNSTRTSSTPAQWALYHWMRDAQDPRLRWLYSRVEAVGRCDVSDATMTYFLLTGDEEATPAKLKAVLADKKHPAPVAVRAEVRIEAENFPVLEHYEIDLRRDRSASHRLAVRMPGAGTGRIRTVLDQPHAASEGVFDIEIRYFDARRGRAEFALSVGGVQQGAAWTASAGTGSWQSRTVPGVAIGPATRSWWRSAATAGRWASWTMYSSTTGAGYPTRPAHWGRCGVPCEAQCGLARRAKGSRMKLSVVAVLAAALLPFMACAQTIRVGVVQTTHENTLAKNLEKMTRFIREAKRKGCDLVVFDENALYESVYTPVVDSPSQADLDAAMARVGEVAGEEGVHVLFGMSYSASGSTKWRNRAVLFDDRGERMLSYRKNSEVPRRFEVRGVPCGVSICSDRNYLEHSDLPCIVQGAKVIIDTSGGHGGDDGRPDLRLIRYRPWAARNNAYVIVCNPVHDDADFMGNAPYGGNSAIVNPDGSVQVRLKYEKEAILVGTVDAGRATRSGAEQRKAHPVFGPWWDMGRTLLEGGALDPVPDIAPLVSAVRDVKIVAAQMACSRDMQENTRKIVEHIGRAGAQGADVVVFPALAVTGGREDDIAAATPAALDAALARIQDAARAAKIHVVVGMPYFLDGARRNCAFVIGDDGTVKTRYAQIAPGGEGERTREPIPLTPPLSQGEREPGESALFAPGGSTKAMWFTVNGAHAIVTVGEDAHWVELGDLAANRGMCLHFHLNYEADASPEQAELRRQRNVLALRYAQFGASVNAADPSGLPNPSAPASGGSLIVSREGGHFQPAPAGLELYLPYQTSIVESAGADEASMAATRKTAARNSHDLERYGYNRARKARPQQGWFDWIKAGAHLIDIEAQSLAASGR